MGFKKDFVWGAATAAYQIEGAYGANGKGLNVWDMLSRKEGFVKDAHNGDVACDHYNIYKDDIKMMAEMGIKAYRFSLSWARILPDGIGRVNEEGLKFYDNLINELVKYEITPYVTLFHWDYPYELYKKGGWLNSESSKWFEDYTKVVVDRYSDRVKYWMTINEPQCFIGLGHSEGRHAPGLKLSFDQVLLAAHNCLLAHGRAVKVIRQYAKLSPVIGFAPVGGIKMPVSSSKEDIEAAREAMFSVEHMGIWSNSWYMDPVFLGKYPEEGLKAYEKYLPNITAEDMQIISQPIDFCGINIYKGDTVCKNSQGDFEYPKLKPGFPETSMEWTVTPEALYWGPKFLYERYKKPILITENGLANNDWVSLDGKVHDPQRIDFLHRYLKEYQKACDEGVETMGYFQWSLMDNFEWAEGYHKRFGLVYVDYESQKRIIKDSGYWYKTVIENNGENL
jgi:beta-glucosidase